MRVPDDLATICLRTVLISSGGELEALREPWAALLESSESNEVMQSPIWLCNWWKVYGAVQGRELCSVAFYDGDVLVGFAPLCRRREGRLGVVRVEWLGSGEEEEHETCSEYIGLIAARGREQAVADAFGELLDGDLLGNWDHVDLTAMSSELVMSPLLTRAMGKATHYEVIGGAPFAKLPETWDGYLAALPSSRRYLIRRSLKAWAKWAGEEPELRWLESEDDFDAAFDMLAKLHAERWSEVGHPGAFVSPLFSEFHRETMRALLREGALWLCWLEAHGEPVVAIYNIVWNNQIRFYQSGRKVGLPKKVRAGLVIHVCAIEQAIAAGRTHYDFLAGTTRYKMQLSNNVRPLMRLSRKRSSMRNRVQAFSSVGMRLGRVLRSEIRSRRSKS